MVDQSTQSVPTPTQVIRIDAVALAMSTGKSINFKGKLAVGQLAGLDLDFRVRGSAQAALIEELVKRAKVEVVDPFIGRTYQATIRLRQSSYLQGQGDRQYQIEVRELDESPEVRILELDGRQYSVVKYDEKIQSEGVSRQAVLRLTPDELTEIRSLIKPGQQVLVRRVDVDEEPFAARFGRFNYWSRHEESDQEYYKQLVRLFPIKEESPRLRVDLAAGVPQDNLIDMVVSLTARFELLVNALAAEGTINTQRRDAILDEEWLGQLDDRREGELFWRTNRVIDAAKSLD